MAVVIFELRRVCRCGRVWHAWCGMHVSVWPGAAVLARVGVSAPGTGMHVVVRDLPAGGAM